MSDVQIGRRSRYPAADEAPVLGDGTSGSGTAADDVLSTRRWRQGVTTGVLAAAPSAAAATGSALIAACGSCLGLGSAAAFSASAAATGGAAGATSAAAASSGLPGWQIGFAVAVFAFLLAVQLRRASVAARRRPGSGSRTAFVLRQIAPGLLAGAVAFAAVQLVVVPWLSAPPVPAGATLP